MRHTLSRDELKNVQSTSGGLTVVRSPLSASAEVSKEFEFKLDYPLYDVDGDKETKDDQIRLQGEIKGRLISTSLDISWRSSPLGVHFIRKGTTRSSQRIQG